MITIATSTAIMLGQTKGADQERAEHVLLMKYGRKNLRTQVSDHGCGRKSKQIFHRDGTLLSDCDL